eukprot:3824175-Pyramimonas_sp.AAC.1
MMMMILMTLMKQMPAGHDDDAAWGANDGDAGVVCDGGHADVDADDDEPVVVMIAVMVVTCVLVMPLMVVVM